MNDDIKFLHGQLEGNMDVCVVVRRQVKTTAISFIRHLLQKFPNNECETTDWDMDATTISYDGGNHPEYASNVFSQVEKVYLKDGKVYVDCEDATEIEIENCTHEECYNIASVLYCYYTYLDDPESDDDDDDGKEILK